MKTITGIGIFAALSVGIAAVWSWHANASARDAQKICESVLLRSSSLRAQLNELAGTRPRASETPLKPETHSGKTISRSENKSLDAEKYSQPPNFVSTSELIRNDPVLQRDYFASQRAAIALTHRAFFQIKALTPAQIEALTEALIKNEMMLDDIRAVGVARGLSGKDPALIALRTEAAAELKRATDSILGESGYQELQEYGRTLSARNFVRAFAGSAALAGLPVSAEQGEAMVRVLMSTVNPNWSAPANTRAPVDWKVSDKLVREVLSEEQYRLFRLGNVFRSESEFSESVLAARLADEAKASE